jgi:ribose-phosphate pyrophosphokinase
MVARGFGRRTVITVNGEPLNVTKFPDGTSQVWKLNEPSILNGEAVVVEWRFELESEVMQLAQLATLLHAFSVPTYLDIPFLPYARQDKAVANHATFALHAFAPILNAMRWDVVTLHDPHSPLATELIERAVVKYYVSEALGAVMATKSDVVCFPDAGAFDKYASKFGSFPAIHADKKRDPLTGYLVTGEVHGDVAGKRVLIVDDICDGGATFIGLAAKLRELGSGDVSLFVSHGLFTKGVKALTQAGISRVFVPTGEVFP